MHDLTLASNFKVPSKIAAATIFVTGQKGSGKTYNAGVIVEEMLTAGVHVVILDPLGVWWGLRHDASGGPGGFPIVILGGEHGDIPLVDTAGDTVAEFIISSGQSVILDMSGFDSDASQDRFVTALLKKLYRLKASDKHNLHLVMDEADMFAPEARHMQAGQQPMIGAAKTIVTKGRSRGLSMTMITQRPQNVNTALRDEADIFICGRILGPRAAGAVKEWIEQHAQKSEATAFMESLPTLSNGESWVWSPQFLKLFQRVKFRQKKTFDSSRTPDPGEHARKPTQARSVDLQKLTDDMKATAEAVASNDPKRLKARIAELEESLRQADIMAAPEESNQLRDARAIIERTNTGIGQAAQDIGNFFTHVAESLNTNRDTITAKLQSLTNPEDWDGAERTTFTTPRRPAHPPKQLSGEFTAASSNDLTRHGELYQRIANETIIPDGEYKILAACIQHCGCSRKQLTVLTGYKKSTRNAYINRLASKGFVTENGESIEVTPAGRKAAGKVTPLPTGAALRAYWINKLPEGESAIFKVLCQHYPRFVERDRISELTNFKKSTRNAYLNRMNAKNLIKCQKAAVAAADDLFA